MTTQLKERPVVLTTEEVNAVLAGNKTQHRAPALTSDQVSTGYKCCYGVASGQVIFTKEESDESFVDDGYISVECPFGAIGDRLWVQEFHARTENENLFTRTHYYADGNLRLDLRHDAGLLAKYSADDMPRWASRLLLEITDIRIERVQYTSHYDAVAEGVHNFDIEARMRDQALSVAQIVFSRYWDTKHQEHHVMWEDNPWVWVIEFKVIKPSEVTSNGND